MIYTMPYKYFRIDELRIKRGNTAPKIIGTTGAPGKAPEAKGNENPWFNPNLK